VNWRTLLTFPAAPRFLVPSDGVRRLIDAHSYRKPGDAKIPVHVVATDFLSGDPWLTVNKVLRAGDRRLDGDPCGVRAGHVERRYLADGAITSNIRSRLPSSWRGRLSCCRPAMLARSIDAARGNRLRFARTHPADRATAPA